MAARTSRLLSMVTHAKRPVYIIVLVAIVAGVVWANSARAATASSSDSGAITPALRLAAGTLNLEGSGQAVDAASAATLLPLWQLLAQLDASSSAAPEEITAVVGEIELNMTSAQLKAIDAMPISKSELAVPSSSAVVAGSAGAASALLAPGIGMFAGDPPMGGGPMPAGTSQGSTTIASSASSTAVFDQVIQLLEKKLAG